MPPTASDIYARAHHHDSSIYHPRWVIYMEEHSTMSTMPKTQVRQFLSWSNKELKKPKVRLWWVLLIHNTTSPVYVTHNEWHICKSTPPYLQYVPLCKWHICKSMPLRLQYMPPTTSDIYARAHHHDFSVCHPQQVACMQEHDTQNLGPSIP